MYHWNEFIKQVTKRSALKSKQLTPDANAIPEIILHNAVFIGTRKKKFKKLSFCRHDTSYKLYVYQMVLDI